MKRIELQSFDVVELTLSECIVIDGGGVYESCKEIGKAAYKAKEAVKDFFVDAWEDYANSGINLYWPGC